MQPLRPEAAAVYSVVGSTTHAYHASLADADIQATSGRAQHADRWHPPFRRGDRPFVCARGPLAFALEGPTRPPDVRDAVARRPAARGCVLPLGGRRRRRAPHRLHVLSSHVNRSRNRNASDDSAIRILKKALFTFLVMVVGLAPTLAAAQARGGGTGAEGEPARAAVRVQAVVAQQIVATLPGSGLDSSGVCYHGAVQ
jgi:hypothetical protein